MISLPVGQRVLYRISFSGRVIRKGKFVCHEDLALEFLVARYTSRYTIPLPMMYFQ
jgi:hypothetical protein